MKQQINKIFGIGLSRTGTSSLYEALTILGIDTTHYPTNYKQIETHKAAVDGTIAVGYRYLDAMFPDSKFIFTDRDWYDWNKSIEAFFKINVNVISELHDGKVLDLTDKVNMALYNATTYNESFMQAYRDHKFGIKRWFKERKDDLLTINICKGEGWVKLCPFLGCDIPNIEFPKSNSKNQSWETLASIF
tara:strand:- start:3 stop:572 length:570 start_codon:yes stop_codon:yes gene_type:complete